MPELEDRLRALAARATWPQDPDLVAPVIAAIRTGAAPAPGGGARRPARATVLRHRLALATGAGLAVPIAGSLAAGPGVRSDLLERLGLKNATVTRVDRLPATPLGRSLHLGGRVTLAVAQESAGFPLRRPAALGAPDEVYLDRGVITFLYRTRGARPLLFSQVRGSTGPFIQKLTVESARRVTISGAPGLIIRGPHVVRFEQPGRGGRDAPARLAATTVLWEPGPLLLRLEGERPAAELLRIARSVR